MSCSILGLFVTCWWCDVTEGPRLCWESVSLGFWRVSSKCVGLTRIESGAIRTEVFDREEEPQDDLECRN